MGLDEGHMTWAGLSQSIPPDMAELVSGQLAMAVAAERYGAPRITFDDLEARPTWARRVMRRWLARRRRRRPRRWARDRASARRRSRGAELDPAARRRRRRGCYRSRAAERWRAPPEPGPSTVHPTGRARWDDVRWGLPESDWRELYYSHVGGYTRSVLDPGAPWWLGAMHLRSPCSAEELTSEMLAGENTFIHCSVAGIDSCWPAIGAASLERRRGTRLTIVVPRGEGDEWALRAGAVGLFELSPESVGISPLESTLSVPWGADGLGRRTLEGGYRIFVGGTARYAASPTTLDHDVAEPYMDPRDRGLDARRPSLRRPARTYPSTTTLRGGGVRVSPPSSSS